MNLLKELSKPELSALMDIIEGKEQTAELYIYTHLKNKGLIKISEKKMLAGCPPIEATRYKLTESAEANCKNWLKELEG